MKALKITTRETDKINVKIKTLRGLINWSQEPDDRPLYQVSYRDKLAMAAGDLADLVSPIREAVDAALQAVNGKATSFTVADFNAVEFVADRAEQLLEARGVAKKHRVGTTVVFSPSGPGASAYKYAAISTAVELKRVADGWRLIGASRCSAWPKSSETFRLTISPEAADNITATAFEAITVRTAEAIAA